jgi:hypothetical protein
VANRDAAAIGSLPREDYTRRLSARRAELAAAIRQHVSFGNLRVAAFGAILAVAIGAFALDWFSGWWLLAATAFFFWSGGRLERAVNARARISRSLAFYERALARLDGRWAGTGETGARFLTHDHLYAADLDLFGEGSLFELLSAARTRVGEDTLASWLSAPAEPAVLRARHDALDELAPRTDLREDLAVLGEDARTGVNATALANWGERAPRLDSSRVPIWAWPLSAAGALALMGSLVLLQVWLDAMQLDDDAVAVLRTYVTVVLGISVAVLWRHKRAATSIFHEVAEAAHNLKLLSGIVGRLEAERFTSARLRDLRAGLDVDGLPPARRLAQLDTLVGLLDSRDHLIVRLIGPLLLWDLHLVYAIERWRRASGPSLRRWLTVVGEMEALSSLAGYRYEHPQDVFPEFVEGAPVFDGEGLGHPLIPADAMVPNDVRLSGPLRVLVVSGSNMSGKSTLLRTVGVNAVLAHAGAPVRARRLRLSPLSIGASIRNQDSLQAGVSRFYAEVTRLGRIMRRAGDASPLLFLIDELLHGTNSHDRRIGAEAIVRGLVDRGAIGLVTTHDLALAHVADALGDRGANVHFEDVLEHGRLRFDYVMRPGVVQKSNALELMRSVGLDV